jgi:ankyrin repeat protein
MQPDMETDLDRALWKVVDTRSCKRQLKDAERCIAAGANVNCQRPMGYPCEEDPSKRETPLLVAIAHCMPKLVNRLLELGADPNLETGALGERTVLHIAVLHNHPEIVGMLIKAGVSMEKKDTIFGWTALHLAVYSCHRHHLSVRMLIADGANVNAMDDTGRTPWQIHLEHGGRFSQELKAILVENGADQPDKTVDRNFTDGTFAWKKRVEIDWIKTLLRKERYHSNRRADALASVVE